MAARTPRSGAYQGIAIHDPRVKYDHLRSPDEATAPSAYTQAGPIAGQPKPGQDSDMVLRARGHQTAGGDLEIRTHLAGHTDAGGYIVRDIGAGDSALEYLGADSYTTITGWDGGIRRDADGSGPAAQVPVIRLESGDLLMVEYSAATTHLAWRYDADTGTWSHVATLPSPMESSGQLPRHELVQLPGGRVLYLYTDRDDSQVHVRYSDDDGDTWADYASAVLASAPGERIFEISAAYTRGVICMILGVETVVAPPMGARQYVSHDLGMSFEPVGEEWYVNSNPAERPARISLVGLPSGRVAMAYWRVMTGGAGTEAYSYRSIDPSEPGYETDRIDLVLSAEAPAYAESALAMWQDEDGVLYVMLEVDDLGADARSQLFFSDDGGSTWTKCTLPSLAWRDSGGNVRLGPYSCASTGGRAALVTRWTSASSGGPQSLGVLYLGGWAWATVGTVRESAQDYSRKSWLGWGRQDGAADIFGGGWIGINAPGSSGWTAAGAGGGTQTSDNRWQVVTSGALRSYTMTDAQGQDEIEGMTAVCSVRVDSGGSLSSPDVALRVRISDYDAPGTTNATRIHEVELRFTTTGFRMYDTIAGAQVGSDQTVDMSTAPVWIMVSMRKASTGELAVWYGSEYGPARRLETAIALSVLADDSGSNPTNQSRIQFGHLASGTATSEWGFVGFSAQAGPPAPARAENYVSRWTNPNDLRSREYSSRSCLVLDDVRIQAVDGPSRLGETWRIVPQYEHGIEALHPQISPSPSRTWRSTGDNQVELIVWDLENDLFSDAYMGSYALVFGLFGHNFRSANLLGWNTGTASWDTIGTIDSASGYTSLAWKRAGSVVRPDDDHTSSADTYLWRDQHAGDTIDLGGEDGPRRIERNMEGAWSTDGSGTPAVRQPRLYLQTDDLTGSEASSGTTGAIWVRDSLLVLREYDGRYQRIALQIPSQATAAGYYEIGSVHLGPLLILGRTYDRGWISRRSRLTDLLTRSDGTRRARVRGGSRRALEVAWVAGAVDVSREQENAPTPDYWSSGANASLPLASSDDVARALEGLLDEIDGPAEPVVYVSKIPLLDSGSDSLHITDRQRILRGRIVSATTRREHVTGDEAVSEAERMNRIVLEEEL